MTLNPGNDRTYTFTEAVTHEVLDAIEDRIEALRENIASGADLHTEADITGFRDAITNLTEARNIINGDA